MFLGNHTSSTEGSMSHPQNIEFYINPQFLQRVHHKLYIGLTYEFQHTAPVSYQRGGIFDKENIIGRFGGTPQE